MRCKPVQERPFWRRCFLCHDFRTFRLTSMSSVIIEHLSSYLQQCPGDQGKIAYLYLSYKEDHPIEHLLGSIIRQLVQDEVDLSEHVVSAYQRQQKRGNEPQLHVIYLCY